MSRAKDPRVYRDDMRGAIHRIGQYTAAGERAFRTDEKTQDGVIRQLAIIGEAARRVPTSLTRVYPEVPWRKIVGMRNILVHKYAETSVARVWATVVQDLPALGAAVDRMLEDLEAGHGRRRAA